MEITAPHRSDESSAALTGFQCGRYSMEILAEECWTSAFFMRLIYSAAITLEKDEKLENWEAWVEQTTAAILKSLRGVSLILTHTHNTHSA